MKTRLQNWTVYQQYYWWEHVYKTEQYISNITDEKTRLQNWTVYQ